MQKVQKISSDLVLVGGGHSHIIVIKMFAMNPIPQVRLTLISDVDYAPYSGMLPGYIAGYYAYDEVHFDLQRLCELAGVRLIRAKVTGIDRHNKTVHCADRPALHYDLLSVNIGSQPKMINIPGAASYATPIKPLPEFLLKLAELDARVQASPSQELKIIFVGGGVGGVESALALKKRLCALQRAHGAEASCEVAIMHRGTKIAENLSPGARRIIARQLAAENIRVYTETDVVKVNKLSVLTADGREFFYTDLFWVTNASAQDWITESGFSVTDDGFIRVNQFLQCEGEADIFAAGDVAHMDSSPRPKAGIFAVRQGRPLYENLCRKFAGRPLKQFRPQTQILTLLGFGEGQAVASRGNFFLSGKLMWVWKQFIDRKFMRRFSTIAAMKSVPEVASANPDRIRCLGCGAKVSSSILKDVLARLVPDRPPAGDDAGILVGMDAAADGAIIRPPVGQLLVQTVDMIPAMFLDLHLFGRITALHCLSDLFAMGSTPHSVLATCMQPYANSAVMANDLQQMLSGVIAELSRHNCHLIGGHTLEGYETALGLTCNGFLAESQYSEPAKLRPLDCIILTKAVGVGTILRAQMMGQAEGRWLSAAIAGMLASNWRASIISNKYDKLSRTDVTGFGLAGHLRAIMPEVGIAVELKLAAIPVLPGALKCLQAGIASTIAESNQSFLVGMENRSSWKSSLAEQLLSDPQTSGGLLFGVHADSAAALVAELQAAGYKDAGIIGSVCATPNENSCLRLIN